MPDKLSDAIKAIETAACNLEAAKALIPPINEGLCGGANLRVDLLEDRVVFILTDHDEGEVHLSYNQMLGLKRFLVEQL